MLNSNKANASHTHTYYSRSSVGDIGWGSESNRTLPVTVNAMAYWSGAYSGTASNLLYCNKGAFGTIVTKNTDDYLSISGGTVTGATTFNSTVTVNNTIDANKNLTLTGNFKNEYTYNNTVTNSANVYISSSYNFRRSTSSSKRYKHNIEPIEGYEKLLDIPIKQYIYNLDYLSEEDQRYNQVVPGIIAEDVMKHYPVAVEMIDGEAEDWNVRFIIPPLIALVQKLWKQVKELESKISTSKV